MWGITWLLSHIRHKKVNLRQSDNIKEHLHFTGVRNDFKSRKQERLDIDKLNSIKRKICSSEEVKGGEILEIHVTKDSYLEYVKNSYKW